MFAVMDIKPIISWMTSDVRLRHPDLFCPVGLWEEAVSVKYHCQLQEPATFKFFMLLKSNKTSQKKTSLWHPSCIKTC